MAAKQPENTTKAKSSNFVTGTADMGPSDREDLSKLWPGGHIWVSMASGEKYVFSRCQLTLQKKS